MMAINQVHVSDCVEGCRGIPDNSIDLVLTSPPYDMIRSYGNRRVPQEFFPRDALFRELFRIVKPGGVVVFDIADQIIDGEETSSSDDHRRGLRAAGFRQHATIIAASSGYRPRNKVAHRYPRTFSFNYVMSKNRKPNTYQPILVPASNAGNEFRKSRRGVDGKRQTSKQPGIYSKLREITDVWVINRGGYHSTSDRRAFAHPAIMPEELAWRHIRTWTRRGDVVCDPLCGSGTTGKMAQLLGRHFIGFDNTAEYIEIALQRTARGVATGRRRSGRRPRKAVETVQRRPLHRMRAMASADMAAA